MKSILPIGIFVAVLSFPPLSRGQSPEETADGFVPLFNGKNFSGWRFGTGSALNAEPKNWSVADGLLKLSGKGGSYLATQWDYADFDVRFEWKAYAKGYTAGICVRSGRALSANPITFAELAAGSLIGVKGAPGVPKLQKPPREWNEWRIVALGDQLTLWCNDTKAWEVTGFKPARGYLGFQDKGVALEFKNLRIKEIGYVTLNDPAQWQSPGGWKQVDDAHFADANAKPRVLEKTPARFTLRLEHQGEAALQLGGKTLLALGDTDVKRLANPPGQWNYLEIALRPKGIDAVVNGTLLTRRIDDAMGALTIVPTGPLALRNLRIREVK